MSNNINAEVVFKNEAYTKEQWLELNPTLPEGELGFESDTNNFKIGDGVTPWDNTLETKLVANILDGYFLGYDIVVYNDEIHLLGGENNNNTLDIHYKWDGSSWEELEPLPIKVSYHRCVVLNNEIHLLGGYFVENSKVTNLYIHYKWDGSSWEELEPLPVNAKYDGCAIIDNELHLLGGWDDNINKRVNTHYIWLPENDSWKLIGDIPSNIFNGFAWEIFEFKNKLHLVSEEDQLDGINYHLIWNNIKYEWETLSTPTYIYILCDHKFINYHNNLYYACNGSTPLIWNEKDDTWTQTEFFSQIDEVVDRCVVYNNELHILSTGNDYLCHYKFCPAGLPYAESKSANKLAKTVFLGKAKFDGSNDILLEDMGAANINNKEIEIKGRLSVPTPAFKDSKENVIVNKRYIESAIQATTFIKVLSNTLSAGETSISFTDDNINDTNDYEYWTSKYGISPNNIERVSNTITLTFDMIDEDIDVQVRIKTASTEKSLMGTPYLKKNNVSRIIDVKGDLNEDKFYLETAAFYPSPYKAGYRALFIFNDEIHTVGGLVGSSSYTNAHYKYNGSEWVKVGTLPYKVSTCGYVIYNNEVHILGGSNGSATDYHYKWDGLSWTQVSTLPVKVQNHQCIVYNNEIHLLGGGTGSAGSTNIDGHYKWNGKEWILITNLPFKVRGHRCVIYDNEIHLIGGCSGTSTPTNYHYKFNGSEWVQVSTLPIKSYNHSCMIYNNEIHMFGGANGSKALNTHYKWDGSSWSLVDTLPYSAYGISCIIYNNEMHLIGGYNGYPSTSVYYAVHYRYDILTSKWVATPLPLPVMTNDAQYLPYISKDNNCITYKDELYLIGGKDTTTYFNNFYKWDDTNKVWTKLANVTIAAASPQCVVLGTEIHLIGGTTATAYNTHYKWTGTAWAKISAALPKTNLTGHQVIVYNNEMHLIGGTSSKTTYLDIHYKWNGSKWVQVSTLPLAVANHQCFEYNGKLHLLGGMDSSGTYLNSHYIWDGNEWTELVDDDLLPYNMPFKVILYNNEIHVIFKNHKHYIYNYNEEYISSWIYIDECPFDIEHASLNIYKGCIYATGIAKYEDEYTDSYYLYNGVAWKLCRNCADGSYINYKEKYYLPKHTFISYDQEKTSIVCEGENKYIKEGVLLLEDQYIRVVGDTTNIMIIK